MYSLVVMLAIFTAIIPQSSHALSCLPTEDYLKGVVGDEEITIFAGVAESQTEESGYTVERVVVSDALQGYVEDEVFVYHEKHPDWMYLCSSGPSQDDTTNIYVTARDGYGKYNVYQRLEIDNMFAESLMTDLEAAEITGEIAERIPNNRTDQILATIQELMANILLLLKEYNYWKTAD